MQAKLGLSSYRELLLSSQIFKSVLSKDLPACLKQYTGQRPSLHYEEGLLSPMLDILSRSSAKWFRGSLCLLAAECYQVRVSDVLPLALACELLHNATLIADDIEDQSIKRRGELCTHIKYGLRESLAASNYMLLLSTYTASLAPASAPLMTRILTTINKAYLSLALGQCSDIVLSQQESTVLSQPEYLQMCSLKTATLVRLPVHLVTLYAGKDEEHILQMNKGMDLLGIAFQLKDDLQNLTETYAKHRDMVGEDISDGKKTLLVTEVVNDDGPSAKRLMDILALKTTDFHTISEAISIIRASSAEHHVTELVAYLAQLGLRTLSEHLPANSAKDRLLNTLRQLLI